MSARQGIRRKQLLNERQATERGKTRSYSLQISLWRGCGPDVRQPMYYYYYYYYDDDDIDLHK